MRLLLAILTLLAISSTSHADLFYEIVVNDSFSNLSDATPSSHVMSIGQTARFDVYVVATNNKKNGGTDDRVKFQSNGLFSVGVRLSTPQSGIIGMVPVKEVYDPNYNPAWNANNAILGYVPGAPYTDSDPPRYNYFNVITPTKRVYDPEFFDEDSGVYGRVGVVTGEFLDAAGVRVDVADNVPTTMNPQLRQTFFQGDFDYSGPQRLKTTPEEVGRVLVGTFTYTALKAGTGTLSTAQGPFDVGDFNPDGLNLVHYNVSGFATPLDHLISQSSITITVVPEPSSMALCGAVAIAGGVGYYRRRKQAIAA